jgi:hypothetical protein
MAIVRPFVRYTGAAPGGPDCIILANTYMTDWGIILAPFAHPDVTLESIEITDLTSPTSGQGSSTHAAIPGTETGSPLPAGAAVLANGAIGRRYRGGKNRGYWPLFTSSDLDTTLLWKPASVTAVATALDDYRIALASASSGGTVAAAVVNVSYFEFSVVVINPTTGRARNVPQRRLPGPLVNDVTAWVPSSRVASQRRRNKDA